MHCILTDYRMTDAYCSTSNFELYNMHLWYWYQPSLKNYPQFVFMQKLYTFAQGKPQGT